MSDHVTNIISAATSGKRLAQAARKDNDHSHAISLIEGAIARLRELQPRLDAVTGGLLSEENRRIAETLAEVLGSSGGIYRSAGDWKRSTAAYDAGCAIEQDERFDLVNSYNLTQRLVARVLLEPAAWVIDGSQIEQERFPDCLRKALLVVDRQTRGPRLDDAWAWADLAMLQVLSEQDAEATWDRMIEQAHAAHEPFVFSSTLKVIEDLLARLAPEGVAETVRSRWVAVRGALDDAAELIRDATPPR